MARGRREIYILNTKYICYIPPRQICSHADQLIQVERGTRPVIVITYLTKKPIIDFCTLCLHISRDENVGETLN